YITAMRTAAGSALSARLLAGEDSKTLAILGTGVQAHAHALMVPRVRQIKEMRIAGRHRENAQRLADTLKPEIDCNLCVTDSFEEAIRSADIVCACTHADRPVVHRARLAPGTHVTSVGYNIQGRELDDETVAAALICVESRDSALAPPPSGSPDL